MRTSAATSPVEDLRREFDAILLAGGAEQPRDLNVPGRELKGIHFAMEFLPQQNRVCEGDTVRRTRFWPPASTSSSSAAATPARIAWAPATGRARARCTSSNCCPSRPTRARPQRPGRCGRCNCASKARTKKAARAIGASTTVKFTGDEDGNVKQLHAVRVGPPPKFEPIPGTEFTLDADLVLLAMGFLGPVKNGMIEQLGVDAGSRAAMWRRTPTTCRRCPASSRPATCAAANRWWSGRSRKAAKPPRGIDRFLRERHS